MKVEKADAHFQGTLLSKAFKRVDYIHSNEPKKTGMVGISCFFN